MKQNPVIKYIWILIPAALLVGGLLFAALSGLFRPAAWYEKDCVIMHALGGIGDADYTNSKEAFDENLAKGRMIFETDFLETSDGRIVLAHTWEDLGMGFSEEEVPTYDAFMSGRIDGRYTPLSLEDLLQYMQDYPEIYVVTDRKLSYGPGVVYYMKRLVETAEEMGCQDVLDRVIVQIYEEQELAQVREVYPFSHFIFTLYHIGFDGDPAWFEEICSFCRDNGVECVTMFSDKWSADLRSIKEKYGLLAAVHTVNDPADGEIYLGSGVDLIYTDTLAPEQMGVGFSKWDLLKRRLKALKRRLF